MNGIRALSSLQCFDTVGWVTEGHSACENWCHIYP